MKCTESSENKSRIMYGPIFCQHCLLIVFYYKGEKLFRYFQSHCQNWSHWIEFMVETFVWDFLTNWELTAGCQIVLIVVPQSFGWLMMKLAAETDRRWIFDPLYSSVSEVLQRGLLSWLYDTFLTYEHNQKMNHITLLDIWHNASFIWRRQLAW